MVILYNIRGCDLCVAIRGKENVEWVEVSEEEAIDLDELKDMFPDDFCGV